MTCRPNRWGKEGTFVVGVPSVHPLSFQISPGKRLNSGGSPTCVFRNAPNTGTQNHHAKQTAATPLLDATGS